MESGHLQEYFQRPMYMYILKEMFHSGDRQTRRVNSHSSNSTLTKLEDPWHDHEFSFQRNYVVLWHGLNDSTFLAPLQS